MQTRQTIFEVKTFHGEGSKNPVKTVRIRGSINWVKRYATSALVDSTIRYLEIFHEGKKVATGRAYMNDWTSMRVHWRIL